MEGEWRIYKADTADNRCRTDIQPSEKGREVNAADLA